MCVCVFGEVGRYEMTCTLFNGGVPAEKEEEDSGRPFQQRGLLSLLLSPTPSQPPPACLSNNPPSFHFCGGG